MVLTTPMVFTPTDGILSVLLDHTHTRWQSVARMRDFFKPKVSKSARKVKKSARKVTKSAKKMTPKKAEK